VAEQAHRDSSARCRPHSNIVPLLPQAFYMRLNDDNRTVAAMDVLVPKVGELIGGSQREERLDVRLSCLFLLSKASQFQACLSVLCQRRALAARQDSPCCSPVSATLQRGIYDNWEQHTHCCLLERAMCMAASKPLIALKRSWNRFWSGGSRRAAWSWSSTNSTWTCGDTALYLTPASASASSAWCDNLRSLFPLTDFTHASGYQAAVLPTQPESADLARQQCLLVSLHGLASLQQQEFEFERVLMGGLLGRADTCFLACAGAVRDRSGEYQVRTRNAPGPDLQAHCISDSSSRLPFANSNPRC